MVYNSNKELKIYYSIGEVADMLHVPETTLRFWEKEFAGYITPHKAGRQVRQYTKENIEQVRLVHHLIRERGMTLKGARQMLTSNKKAAVQTMEVIDRLKSIRQELVDMKQALDRTVY